jgi:hypothetical protein
VFNYEAAIVPIGAIRQECHGRSPRPTICQNIYTLILWMPCVILSEMNEIALTFGVSLKRRNTRMRKAVAIFCLS